MANRRVKLTMETTKISDESVDASDAAKVLVLKRATTESSSSPSAEPENSDKRKVGKGKGKAVAESLLSRPRRSAKPSAKVTGELMVSSTKHLSESQRESSYKASKIRNDAIKRGEAVPFIPGHDEIITGGQVRLSVCFVYCLHCLCLSVYVFVCCLCM